ncbi:unnamed protein product [Rotaria magnacalcarata]|uniref:NAD(+)--protein-arginine ADP-ribosyltransferase n=1 Tax=Rotaria magnacalcarata TaxID=392030 RepID=A0A816K805_9BILA|nr:unnamed protein product [Rotaria magnacalcarata]CAF3899402.1 unnamed protein product [Rotaria magnacalcarata]
MGNIDSVSFRHSSSVRTSLNSIAPLYQACHDGDEEQVRTLLRKYSYDDLNQQEFPYDGNTCLHVAAANGYDNIVQLLLKHGCYRSSLLNSQNQSAYEVAALNKESTRLLFLRHEENNSLSKDSSRFFEQNALDCFDIIKVEDNLDNELDNDKRSAAGQIKTTVQTFKTEEEKQHEIEYSASSKTMCQSSFGRFCVNFFHSDEPLDHRSIMKRLKHLLEEVKISNYDDYAKIDDLVTQYEQQEGLIEQLLHLYTLETKFYDILKTDCLPLAIPLFIHLPKLKERFFKGRVYRGMHMTYEQLLTYQIATEIPGTLLQTRSFSSTSMNRSVAEEFAYLKKKDNDKKFCVLFIFDFPDVCDQAINLTRISSDKPCLSEYENEQEVLILPWTLFEVKRVRKASDEDDLCTIYLTNIIIPKKNLLSTFKWSYVEFKKNIIKERKFQFNCAFQKYKTSLTKN